MRGDKIQVQVPNRQLLPSGFESAFADGHGGHGADDPCAVGAGLAVNQDRLVGELQRRHDLAQFGGIGQPPVGPLDAHVAYAQFPAGRDDLLDFGVVIVAAAKVDDRAQAVLLGPLAQVLSVGCAER